MDAVGEHRIGQLNEKSLHRSLKHWYARSGDELEVNVDKWVVDIVRDDVLIEIQTRNFSALKKKLRQLVCDHTVRLIYPITSEKWIIKPDPRNPQKTTRRKSPKKGTWLQIFEELIYIPDLLTHENFSLELLLILEEEVQKKSSRRSAWRRKGWVIDDRRLVQVVDQKLLRSPTDLMALIPNPLNEPFTTAELAAATGRNRRFAQKAAYCLKASEAIMQVGTRGRAKLYMFA